MPAVLLLTSSPSHYLPLPCLLCSGRQEVSGRQHAAPSQPAALVPLVTTLARASCLSSEWKTHKSSNSRPAPVGGKTGKRRDEQRTCGARSLDTAEPAREASTRAAELLACRVATAWVTFSPAVTSDEGRLTICHWPVTDHCVWCHEERVAAQEAIAVVTVTSRAES